MSEPNQPPTARRPKARRGGILGLLKALFFPGPWRWVSKETPPPPRFHPGEHMHGLETREFDPSLPEDERDPGLEDRPVTPTRRAR